MALNAHTRHTLMRKLAGETVAPVVPSGPMVGNGVAAAMPLPTAPLNSGSGMTSLSATKCLLLTNMFNPAEETEPHWDEDIKEDVADEVAKYGTVETIHIDKVIQRYNSGVVSTKLLMVLTVVVRLQNSQGWVFIRFSSEQAFAIALAGLNGRWFAKRQILA